MPTKSQFKIQAYGQTDVGKMRTENDDSFLVDESLGLYAVADGLGGLPEGGLASSMAIETLRQLMSESLDGELDYPAMFAEANVRVQAEGRRINEDLGIGTTLTAATVDNNELKVGHIGDSGLVIFSPNTWLQLTHDHTMAQDMLDRLGPGEHAYIPEYFSHTLTRCIGQNTPTQTDVYRYALEGDERILIFSDGVTKVIKMRELHEMVFAASDTKQLVKRIIKLANERGGPDNVTAVALFVD